MTVMDIGEDTREFEMEPLEEPMVEPTTAPAEAPEREEVPA